MTVFSGLFRTARKEGLGVTLHVAEVGAKQTEIYLFLNKKTHLGMDDGVDKGKKLDDGGEGDEGIAQL
jgi:hypothetical protein